MQMTNNMPKAHAENSNGIARGLAGLWCTLLHDSVMWPIHGQYECRRCGLRRPVPWAQLEDESREPSVSAPERTTRRYVHPPERIAA